MSAGEGGRGGGSGCGSGSAGRFTVPLQRPAVRASLFLEGEGEDDGEGEEEVMGRHRVLGRMGPSLAFTQAMAGHRRSHPSAESQT
jgi:hypothetical protein